LRSGEDPDLGNDNGEKRGVCGNTQKERKLQGELAGIRRKENIKGGTFSRGQKEKKIVVRKKNGAEGGQSGGEGWDRGRIVRVKTSLNLEERGCVRLQGT